MNPYDPNHVNIPVFAKVGQKAVIFNQEENKILVLRRSEKSQRAGGWDFPGGGLEFGEDPTQGIRREIEEETLIQDLQQLTPVHVYSDINHEDEFFIIIGYRAFTSQTLITLSWEHDYFEWMSIDDALALQWPPFHKAILDQAIKSL